MKRFLLARHGETAWNREGRIQGWSRIALNQTGRRQATALGDFIATQYAPLDAVIASDLPRAVETATLAREGGDFSEVRVTYERAWRERDFGVYQGHDSDTFFDEHPQFAILDQGQSAAAAVPEDGESYLAFRDRVRSAWQELVTSAPDRVLLVAHGGVLRTILGSVLDLGMREALQKIHPGNATLTEVQYNPVSDSCQVVHRARDRHLRRPSGEVGIRPIREGNR